MDKNNPFDPTINSLKETADAIDNATRKAAEEETGEPNNPEEANTDPAYVLYNTIANTSIELLQNEVVVKAFQKLASTTDAETSKCMIEMFAILLTQSAYNAILFYDELLKQELTKQFNHFADNINENRATINGHHSAMLVFRKQLNEIASKLKIEQFAKENNITPE